MNAAEALAAPDKGTLLPDVKPAGLLLCRVRYFSDGAVIGSKTFVDEVFTRARDRFTAKRKDGARRLRGNGKAAAGVLRSMRDLRVRGVAPKVGRHRRRMGENEPTRDRPAFLTPPLNACPPGPEIVHLPTRCPFPLPSPNR